MVLAPIREELYTNEGLCLYQSWHRPLCTRHNSTRPPRALYSWPLTRSKWWQKSSSSWNSHEWTRTLGTHAPGARSSSRAVFWRDLRSVQSVWCWNKGTVASCLPDNPFFNQYKSARERCHNCQKPRSYQTLTCLLIGQQTNQMERLHLELIISSNTGFGNVHTLQATPERQVLLICLKRKKKKKSCLHLYFGSLFRGWGQLQTETWVREKQQDLNLSVCSI